MNKELVAKEGKVIFIRIGNKGGIYAHINYIVRDVHTKNRIGWIVHFTPLLEATFSKEKVMAEIQWSLNDDHLYGEEFTMGGVRYCLCKIIFPTDSANVDVPPIAEKETAKIIQFPIRGENNNEPA